MPRLVPADYLKIDRSIVAAAPTDGTARSVLAALLAFAREAETFVIAKGVETEAMLDVLSHAGRPGLDRQVYAVQGYLTGQPSATVAQTPSYVPSPRGRAASRPAGFHGQRPDPWPAAVRRSGDGSGGSAA